MGWIHKKVNRSSCHWCGIQLGMRRGSLLYNQKEEFTCRRSTSPSASKRAGSDKLQSCFQKELLHRSLCLSVSTRQRTQCTRIWIDAWMRSVCSCMVSCALYQEGIPMQVVWLSFRASFGNTSPKIWDFTDQSPPFFCLYLKTKLEPVFPTYFCIFQNPVVESVLLSCCFLFAWHSSN